MTDLAAVDAGVRQLYGRYVDAVWRQDQASFVDCFTKGAEWKIAGRRFRGCAEIAQAFEAFMATSERILMLAGLTVLEPGDGTATGRTPVSELIKLKDGQSIRTIGFYHDRFVDGGDRWRFGWRHWSLFYYGPPDLSGQFYDSPDYGPPPGMPSDDEPTLVRRDS